VRLLHGHGIAGLFLPVLRERGVELLVQLAGRVVGDISVTSAAQLVIGLTSDNTRVSIVKASKTSFVNIDLLLCR